MYITICFFFSSHLDNTILCDYTSIVDNHISGLKVSVVASSAVDRVFEPGRLKPKTVKLVFAASPLSKQH